MNSRSQPAPMSFGKAVGILVLIVVGVILHFVGERERAAKKAERDVDNWVSEWRHNQWQGDGLVNTALSPSFPGRANYKYFGTKEHRESVERVRERLEIEWAQFTPEQKKAATNLALEPHRSSP